MSPPGVRGDTCALMVSSGAGGDALRDDLDDRMNVFRGRIVQEDHRGNSRPEVPGMRREGNTHPRSEAYSRGSGGARLRMEKALGHELLDFTVSDGARRRPKAAVSSGNTVNFGCV